MAETLQQHNIDIKNTTPDWVKQQIENVYKETNNDLSGLKDKISNNTLEKELTLDHVKTVLNNALTKFNDGKTMKEVYGEKTVGGKEGMGAGLNVSIQVILKKMGIDPGEIDGFYGNRTRTAVESFQEKWNNEHPNDKITKDGWAGQETIKRMIESMNATGENVTPTGENVTPTGENITPTGENVTPTGENITPTGENITPTGENVTPEIIDVSADAANEIAEAFKNSDFKFEGNYPANIENDIKTIFNDAKQGLGLEGNYSIQLTNNSVPGQETIADHNTIDLKEELNGNNDNSLIVTFTKIKGKDVDNFRIRLTKTNQENKKVFTVSTISSVEQFAYDKEIINKLKNNKRLPQDWTKSDPAVTFDLNKPFNFYLNVQNGENKEEITFDKDGKILENQIFLLNNKTYKRNENGDLLNLEDVSTTPATLETLKQNLLTEFDKQLDNTYHPYLHKVYNHEIK